MYPCEGRTRAVELYIKLGKRIRSTIRQLGYPTKNVLKGWCRQYGQQLGIPGRCNSEASLIRLLSERDQSGANLINRDFKAAAANEKWPTGITESQISAGMARMVWMASGKVRT
ncbi:hypothetical protein LMG7141_02356 [Ralstonia condita]|uniref:Transposase n=1 Tax=Ralstonia condita TaxID=3058600 RepID=A0ABN9IUE3_9RALS|nr:hypothetical protein LMG7141_02356 [Ralstonia sp. LMG 7141]